MLVGCGGWCVQRHGANIHVATFFSPSLSPCPSQWGYAPFLWAAVRGSSDVMTVLKENGADTSVRDEQNNMAIHLACRNGHANIVSWYKQHNLLDPATYAAIGERGESVIDKASHHEAVLVELLTSVPGCMDMIMNNRIDYAEK